MFGESGWIKILVEEFGELVSMLVTFVYDVIT